MTNNELEAMNEQILKQQLIANRLIVIIAKILLEGFQDQIKDKYWHELNDEVNDLRDKL